MTSSSSNANQTITGTNGNNTLRGGNGNDTITGLAGNDRIDGGAGNDWIDAGAGHDVVDGGSGNDTIYAGDGNDIVRGGDGDDYVEGGAGDDKIDGDDGNDRLLGGAGNDVIDGEDGNDWIEGGEGNDRLDGGDGNDVLLGGAGNDELEGGRGDDWLDGGSGINKLDGDSGNDVLVYRMSDHAGEGVGSKFAYSEIDGGSDCDTFVFQLTRAEWLRSDVQNDVARLVAYLRNGGSCRDFVFTSVNLKLDDIENFVVVVDGLVIDPRDEGVTLRADAITAGEDSPSVAFNLLANDLVPDLVKTVTVTNGAKGTVQLVTDFSDPARPVANVVYTPNPSAYQYLAAGERATDSFTYTVTDADGDVSTQTVTVTILGANDGPTIVSGAFAGAVTEDAASSLSASGAITFEDVDLTDSHTVSVGAAQVSVTGNPAAGFAGANGFGSLNAVVVENTADQNAQGKVNWTFTANNAEVQKLAAGQVATQVYTLTLTDRNGASVTQKVTITLTGTNDGPTVTGADAAGRVCEDGATAVAGNIGFADVDLIDTHSVSSVAQGSGYRGAFNAVIDNSATGDGAGNVKWSFAVDNAAIQDLAQGEVLTQKYAVTVRDNNGATTTQIVTVTIVGVNDAPVITSNAAAATGAVREAGVGAGEAGAGVAAATGQLTSRDVDNGATATWSGGKDGVFGSFAIDPATGRWTYTLDNARAATQALKAGEVRTEAFLTTVTDDKGATATQLVTVTVTGSNDAPVITSANAAAAGAVREAGVNDAGTPSVQGQLTSSDVDAGATATWSIAGNSAFGAIAIDPATGKWTYTLDNARAATQALKAGEVRTERFTATVTDDFGATATQMVTVTITGTNDAPVAQVDSGALAEDAVLTGSVATNDGDVDAGAVLSYALNAPVAGLTLAADGSYRFETSDARYQRLALGEQLIVIAYYTVTDEHGASAQATLTITLTGTNDAPTAVADAAAVNEDSLLTGSVAGNDGDVDHGARLTWTLDAPVAGLALAPTGEYRFDAGDAAYQALALGEMLVVTAHYTVTDEHGATAQATLTVTVTGTNDAPIVTSLATDAAGAVREDGTIAGVATTGGQLASRDVDHGATATWSGSVDGTYGAFAIDAAGRWTYTLGNDRAATQALKAGQTMVETFVATVTDEHGATATQVVTVTITGSNDAPTITSTVAAAAGAVTEAGVIAGTAATGGQLTASDVDADATATWSGSQDSAFGGFAIDAATGRWTYTLADDRAATQALKAGEVRTETFVATVTDEQGATATQVVTVTVTGTNDAPVVTSSVAAAAGAVVETGVTDAGIPSASGQLTSTDVDADATATWSIAGVSAYGAIAIDPATGRWTYTLDNARAATQALAAGEVHTETFTATVTDDQGATATQVVTITITGSNDAPTAAADTASAFEDQASIRGSVAINDGDVDAGARLSYALTGAIDGLTLNADGSYRFDPSHRSYQALAKDQELVIIASYVVTDEHGASATATLTITLTGTNDAPTARIDSAATAEDAAAFTGSVAGNDGDVDAGAVLTWALVEPVAGLTLGADGSYRFDPSHAAYQALAQGENRTVIAEYAVTDEHGVTAYSALVIVIAGTNDAPVVISAAADAAGAVREDGVVAGTPSAAGQLASSDVDHGATATWSGSRDGTFGSFAIGANGAWTYTLANDRAATQALKAGETVTETFLATVTDEHGATATQAVTITVAGTNDAPVVTSTAAAAIGAVTEAGTVVGTSAAAGQLTSSDVDRDATAIWSGAAEGTYGSFAITANGAWTYTLGNGRAVTDALAAGETRTETFTATVTDDQGAIATQVVTVTITGTNDSPVVTSNAGAASGSVTEAGNLDNGAAVGGTPSVSNTLTASDVDLGAQLSWSGNAAGTYGSFAITAGGVWTYTLDNANAATAALAEGQTRTETFTATVTDEFGASATQVVTVTVAGTNDSPVITSTAAAGTGAVVEAGNLDDGTAAPGIAIATGTLSSSDVDSGATATWTGNTSGTYGTFAINPATGQWTYTLDNGRAATQALKEGQAAVETFTATVTDDKGATATQVVTVTVTGTNDSPVAVADTGGGLTGGTIVSFDEVVSTNLVLSTGVPVTSNGYTFASAHAHVLAPTVGGTPINGTARLMYADGGPITMTKAGGGAFDLSSFQLGELTRGRAASAFTVTGTRADGTTVTANFTIDGIADGAGGADDFQTITLANFTGLVSVTFGSGSQVFTIDTIVLNAAAGLSTTENAALTIDALANDTDVDAGAVLTIVGANVPAGQGAVSIVANKLLFNPGSDFDYLAVGQLASVTIGYTITDEFGATSTATATVVVTGTNDAPVARPDTGAVAEDATLTGSVATNDSDVDTGAVLTYALNSAVAGLTLAGNGGYSFNAGHAAYQALALGQTQVVTASYTVTDQFGATSTASLTITITGTNDAPVAVADVKSVAEDATVTGSVATNDSDADAGAVLTYALTGNAPTGLTFNADGSYSFNAAQPGFQALGTGQSAQVVVGYTVTDQHGAAATGTLTITVTGTDDLPVLTMSNAANTYVENAAAQVVDGALTLTDIDGPNLNGAVVSITANFNAAQDSLTFTSQYGITGSYNAATGQLTLSGSATAAQYQEVLRSVAYRNGSDNPTTGDRTITYAVTPNGTSSQYYAANGHFYEFVTANGITWDAARAAAAARTLYGQTGYLATVTSAGENAFITSKLAGNGWLGASDAAVENEWRWMTGPEAGQLFYTGRGNGTGVAVNGAYNAWAGSEPNDYGSGEDYAHFYANGTWNDFPNAGGVQGYIVEYGGMPGDAPAGFTGTAIVRVQAVNDVPVATNLSTAETYTEDQALNLADIVVTDPDTASVTVTLTLSNPAAGALSTGTSGAVTATYNAAAGVWTATGATANVNALLASLTFTPAANFNGGFTIATSVSDGIATVTGSKAFTGIAVNDAPVVAGDMLRTTTEDEGAASIYALNTVYDVDDDALSVTGIGTLPAGVSFDPATQRFTLDASNEAYQYLPAGQRIEVRVSYGVTDGTATVPAVAGWIITGTNDAPVITSNAAAARGTVIEAGSSDAGQAQAGTPSVTGTLTATDVDTGATRSWSAVTTAGSYGTFAIDAATGKWTYTLDNGRAATNALREGQTVTETFTARVTDDKGAIAEQLVTVTVNGANDAPTLTGVNSPVTFLENSVNAVGQVLDSAVVLTDPDANLAGGRVVVSGLLAEDRVGVAAGGPLTISVSTVLYNGVAIGVVSGGSGGTMTVTLNANATVAGVQALIQGIVYGNASNTPTAQRTLVINVFDADGGQLAASFGEQTGANNPFASYATQRSAASFADIDGDGDQDMIVGSFNTGLSVFRNNGGGSFTQLTGTANPLGGISNAGNLTTTAWADLNGDGRMDMVLGADNRPLRTFLNNANGTFTEVTGAANPFNGVNGGYDAAPTFIDYDGDGDQDLVLGDYGGGFRTFRNTGGVFTELTGSANPFAGLSVGDTHSKPAAVDFDNDGDLDIVSGSRFSGLVSFRNNGDGTFTKLSAAENPYASVALGQISAPAFADLNGDGIADAVFGSDVGTLRTFTSVNGAQVVVNVTAQNDAPVLTTALLDQSSFAQDAFSYTVPAGSFTDPDGNALSYSATLAGGAALPGWLSFNAATRTFSGTPAEGQAGTYNVVVTASDGSLTATDTVAFTIRPNTYTGTSAADTYTGTVRSELIIGGGGNDVLTGGAGDDTIYGDAQGELGPSAAPPAGLTAVAQSYYTSGSALRNGLGGSAGFGENVVARNDDSFSPLINLTSIFGSQGVNFFGTYFTTISVNNNGNLTFGSQYGSFTPSPIAPTGLPPLIAAFWTDIDTRAGNVTTSPGGNSTGTNLVYYDLDTVNRVFTATWDDVGQYSNGTVPNSFQIQLVDRGSGDFDIILRYEIIQWNYSGARAGYSGGGTAYELPLSQNGQTLDLDTAVGNTGINGVYVFQVRNGQVSTSANDVIDGGAGHDTLAGGTGLDTFVFRAGEADGDTILDFNGSGAAAGDSLAFYGFGTLAQGASFVQLDANRWQINSADGTRHEIITFANGAAIDPTDFTFFP